MKRMMHPQHGFQMVQPADLPMFERAGWVEAVEPEPVAIEETAKTEPEQPKRRGRK